MDATTAAPKKPLLTIQPSTGWAALNLRELWEFRDLLFTLAGRDVKLRYKQTLLGVAWVIIQPLLGAGIFTFVFGTIAGLDPPGDVPLFVYTFAGMLAWNSFSRTFTRAADSLVSNASMMAKIFFPRLLLPVSSILGTMIDFCVALTLLLVMLTIFWRLPGPSVLLMPVCLALLQLLSLGLGLWAAAYAVSFRDVKHMQPIVTQFMLWASPVGYAVTQVPERYRTFYYLNPLASLLEGFKWSLLGVGEVEWGWLAYAALVCVLVMLSGVLAFKRMEREFADVI